MGKLPWGENGELKKNRDMQLELDKQVGREREISEDSREESGQRRSKHNATGNAALCRNATTKYASLSGCEYQKQVKDE